MASDSPLLSAFNISSVTVRTEALCLLAQPPIRPHQHPSQPPRLAFDHRHARRLARQPCQPRLFLRVVD